MRWPWLSRRADDASRKFGYAVVGLGHGADKFLEALRDSPTVRVAALVSGDPRKAEVLARTHRIPASLTYAVFDRLADMPEVDAVYLCLPNHLHREFTERALRAGKHILCEKPLAPTVADCHAMIQAARDNNRLLATGYRLPFTSVHTRARDLILGGTLGEITAIRSGFGFHAKPGWRLDPTLPGTGSLFDVGIYPINTLHSLFGDSFTVDTVNVTHAPNAAVEVSTDWQGRLANGASLQCGSSFVASIPDFFEVQTTRARLTVQPAFSYSGLQLTVRANSPADRKLSLRYRTPRTEPSAFRLEAEHLAHCAQSGDPLRIPGETGLRDVETIEQILSKARARP